jgi:hypothetical protein
MGRALLFSVRHSGADRRQAGTQILFASAQSSSLDSGFALTRAPE